MKIVVIIRKDLKMRRGKEIAQGGHAVVQIVYDLCDFKHQLNKDNATHPHVDALITWLGTGQKKVAVSCDSEAELLELYNKADAANMPCSLITDSGCTEFHGVPTKTCVAIGPWDEAEIDKITGHLKLL